MISAQYRCQRTFRSHSPNTTTDRTPPPSHPFLEFAKHESFAPKKGQDAEESTSKKR